MKKVITIFCFILCLTFLTACSGASLDAGGFPSGGVPGIDSSSGSDANGGNGGRMTAGAYDDNIYYDAYKSLFEQGEKFYELAEKQLWQFNTLQRLKLTVTNGDGVLSNANVTLNASDGTVINRAQTNSNGVAYLFGYQENKDYTITIQSGDQTKNVKVDSADMTVEMAGEQKHTIIELMFVVDITGSMGDELSYLRDELSSVVTSISDAFEDVTLNLALLFYKDKDDKVPFDYYDFLDVTKKENLEKHIKNISNQVAEGGGDYEEAVDEALKIASEQQWSTNSTKIIFHLHDAPPHNGQSYETVYRSALNKLQEKGVRVCPVLASGADLFTEYVTRQTALITGGTFCFITDDSGIGNSHLDPELPNVVIEKLNDMMVRLVKGYYTGTFEAPVWYDNNTYYSITVDTSNKDILFYGLSGHYMAGQEVSFIVEYNDIMMDLYCGDTLLSYGELMFTIEENKDRNFIKFKFTMPEENITIYLKERV